MRKKIFYIIIIFAILALFASCECQPTTKKPCWGELTKETPKEAPKEIVKETPVEIQAAIASAPVEETVSIPDIRDTISDIARSSENFAPKDADLPISLQSYIQWRSLTE
ncbi:MAG: hypothetical protein FWF38_03310 [Spirochaetaceae bacterium]|nr:hypothetical protein [Spirochaetaceae bacterium]